MELLRMETISLTKGSLVALMPLRDISEGVYLGELSDIGNFKGQKYYRLRSYLYANLASPHLLSY